jgi:multidrug resistance efflux pump
MSPVAYLGWVIIDDNVFIKADGTVTTSNYNVRAREEGYVGNVFVKIGDIVKKGQLMVSMKSPLLSAELVELQKQLKILMNLQGELDSKSEVTMARMKEEAVAYVAASKDFYDKMLSYKKRGLINVFDLRQARDMYHDAKVESNQLIDEGEVARSIIRSDAYLPEIRALDLRIALLKQKMLSLNIYSQATVVVNSVNIYDGEFVEKGKELMLLSIYDGKSYVKAYLDSKYLQYVYKDKPVSIEFDDGTDIPGVIENNPVYTESIKGASSLFSDKSSKIVVMIKANDKIPTKYNINGVPLEVYIGRLD